MPDDWKIHPRRPLPALLNEAKELAVEELHRRLADEGHPDIRSGHGCVFRFIDVEGSRLTDLADRAGLTKQAVGEVATDLEALGYVERVPDPGDGRAKIVRLTAKGRDAADTAQRIFADIEARWAERFGEERMRILRETLEAIAEGERQAATAA
jgi:DNA-binding MarR family transcriptional regulator